MLYIIIRNPNLKSWLGELISLAPAHTTPPPPATTTPPPAAEGAGEFPYPPTGSANELEDQGEGTRHYASGKPDDVTHEWESTTNAQSYMIVIDITLTEIDHDDTITFKYGGTHNGSGWYGGTYTFEAGQSGFGAEESHPDYSECLEGTAIGSLVNQQVMLAAININKGEKLEVWSKKPDGAWQKDAESANGVCGFKPSESEDEIQIRIDGAPGIDMHSANWYEIQGTGASTGGGEITNEPETDSDEEGGAGEDESNADEPAEDEEEEEEEEEGNLARVLTAKKSRKKLRRRMFNKTYRNKPKEEGDFIPYNIKLRDLHYTKLGGIV